MHVFIGQYIHVRIYMAIGFFVCVTIRKAQVGKGSATYVYTCIYITVGLFTHASSMCVNGREWIGILHSHSI